MGDLCTGPSVTSTGSLLAKWVTDVEGEAAVFAEAKPLVQAQALLGRLERGDGKSGGSCQLKDVSDEGRGDPPSAFGRHRCDPIDSSYTGSGEGRRGCDNLPVDRPRIVAPMVGLSVARRSEQAEKSGLNRRVGVGRDGEGVGEASKALSVINARYFQATYG